MSMLIAAQTGPIGFNFDIAHQARHGRDLALACISLSDRFKLIGKGLLCWFS